MKVWAFVSQKGGSGRSTLCTQLATYACQLGEKVVIIDLDPQGSSSAWHAVRGKGESPAVLPCTPPNLSKVIRAIRDAQLASMVMIDTAPHTDKGAVEAITAADLVICPQRPGMFDQSSLLSTVSLLDLAESKSRAVGVVNAVRSGRAAKSDYASVSETLESYEIRVAATFIKDRRAFMTAVEEGRGVTEKKSKDEAAKEIVGLWNELSMTLPVVVNIGDYLNDKTR